MLKLIPMNNKKTRNYYLSDIPIEEAISKYFDSLEIYFENIDFEEIEVTKSNHRITSEPIFAKISSPNFNLAAMDGISINHKSAIGATETSPNLLIEKDFNWVDTGDPIDDNYDAVIMIEDIYLLIGLLIYVELLKQIFLGGGYSLDCFPF